MHIFPLLICITTISLLNQNLPENLCLHCEFWYFHSTDLQLNVTFAENYRNGFIGNGDSNDLTQCYSVTTGKVSTLLKAPSCSSLSSIEVAEINTSNKLMSRNYMKGDSSIGFGHLSSHQTNGYVISKGQSEDVTYLTNTSSLPPMHRRQTERYIGPNIKSSLIRTSKVIRTLQHSVCSHGIDR